MCRTAITISVNDMIKTFYKKDFKNHIEYRQVQSATSFSNCGL